LLCYIQRFKIIICVIISSAGWVHKQVGVSALICPVWTPLPWLCPGLIHQLSGAHAARRRTPLSLLRPHRNSYELQHQDLQGTLFQRARSDHARSLQDVSDQGGGRHACSGLPAAAVARQRPQQPQSWQRRLPRALELTTYQTSNSK